MQISYNGVLAVYTYNCPHAHRLRNIEKIRVQQDGAEEGAEESVALTAREFGIQQHDTINEYLQGKAGTYEYSTDIVEWFKAQPTLETEVQHYYGLDGTPLDRRPNEGDYISTREDAVAYPDNKIVLGDWKFGNPDYGATKHYDETDFFLAMAAGRKLDAEEYEVVVHFPMYDYTLPKRIYNQHQLGRLQTKYMMRIETILNDKFFKPNPSKQHCKLCEQRSEDAGGTGACEYSVI